MTKERQSIDRLASTRYILMTSAPLTPKNKSALAEIIGPSLQTPGDIFGPGDLNALLRKYPDIEKAHQKLWAQSTSVLETVVTNAVGKALSKPEEIPAVLASLLPRTEAAGNAAPVKKEVRDTLFLIKSSPVDDEFALWVAPKLEAEPAEDLATVFGAHGDCQSCWGIPTIEAATRPL
jgi:hypothetical protein